MALMQGGFPNVSNTSRPPVCAASLGQIAKYQVLDAPCSISSHGFFSSPYFLCIFLFNNVVLRTSYNMRLTCSLFTAELNMIPLLFSASVILADIFCIGQNRDDPLSPLHDFFFLNLFFLFVTPRTQAETP